MLMTGCSIIGGSSNSSDAQQVLSFGSNKKSKKDNKKQSGDGTDDAMKYLDTQLLSQDITSENHYQTYQVIRGEFVTKYDSASGELYFPNLYSQKTEYEKGKMIFEQFVVEQGQYVKKGDPIADVHMELDTTELNELQLRLSRYYERLDADEKTFESKKKAYRARFYEKMTTAQSLQLRLEYDDFLLQWENAKKNWNKTIEDTKEAIDVYVKTKAIHQIEAGQDGYVTFTSWIWEGTELKNGDVLCSIIPEGSVYLKMDNSNQLLNYGRKVTVSFGKGKEGYEGTVVSVDPKTTSYDLGDKSAYIKVACNLEDVYTFRTANVSYVAESMVDVLLVDRAAVTMENDIPYVTVREADGSLLKTGFFFGGSNQNYFWVYGGLSEGTTVVK